MLTLRQQDLCLASSTVALESCDNTKAELRWYHKSSDSALVGFSSDTFVSVSKKQRFFF